MRSLTFTAGVNTLVVIEASGRNSMVECQLPKLKVAGSIPVARSNLLTNS
jgi:hypothetical protein